MLSIIAQALHAILCAENKYLVPLRLMIGLLLAANRKFHRSRGGPVEQVYEDAGIHIGSSMLPSGSCTSSPNIWSSGMPISTR